MDIDDLMNALLPDFPDAQLGESEDGEAVILTGVKASSPKPSPPRTKTDSKWFLEPCMKLQDWCAEHELNVEQVLTFLADSKISLGSADDVLVRETRLCKMLGLKSPDEEDGFMISLAR